MKTVTAKAILNEIKSLRREVALFLPSESLTDFTNQKEIRAAFRRARK
jgi:hypothetical protein